MSGENLLGPRRRRTSLLERTPWEEEEDRQREFAELDRAAGSASNTGSDPEEDHEDDNE